jgi:hypothetical protein
LEIHRSADESDPSFAGAGSGSTEAPAADLPACAFGGSR